MQIQLIRKLADYLDGIDLGDAREGDVLDLPQHEAELVIAEGWAVPLDEPSGDEPSSHEIRGDSSPLDLAAAADKAARRIRAIHEHRRAEDRYREELQDSRARTVRGNDKDQI